MSFFTMFMCLVSTCPTCKLAAGLQPVGAHGGLRFVSSLIEWVFTDCVNCRFLEYFNWREKEKYYEIY
jgi:hypothetical protein